MKILVDTCGWLEWLTESKLLPSFEGYLKKTNDLIVPTLIQYELFKWICREKDSGLALEVIAITEMSTVIPIDTRLSLFAAQLAIDHKLSMADSIIYATSQMNNALLVTSDKHFKTLPNVKYFEK